MENAEEGAVTKKPSSNDAVVGVDAESGGGDGTGREAKASNGEPLAAEGDDAENDEAT